MHRRFRLENHSCYTFRFRFMYRNGPQPTSTGFSNTISLSLTFLLFHPVAHSFIPFFLCLGLGQSWELFYCARKYTTVFVRAFTLRCSGLLYMQSVGIMRWWSLSGALPLLFISVILRIFPSFFCLGLGFGFLLVNRV